jgi:hypothetical protein
LREHTFEMHLHWRRRGGVSARPRLIGDGETAVAGRQR